MCVYWGLEYHQHLKQYVCPFHYTTVAGNGKVVPVNQVNNTSLVTPTDRPKSVRNRCSIEHFCSVLCPYSVDIGAFFIGLRTRTSDLFLFPSLKKYICLNRSRVQQRNHHCVQFLPIRFSVHGLPSKQYHNII